MKDKINYRQPTLTNGSRNLPLDFAFLESVRELDLQTMGSEGVISEYPASNENLAKC